MEEPKSLDKESDSKQSDEEGNQGSEENEQEFIPYRFDLNYDNDTIE